jgi:two-component system NtrC family sensor kinase
VDALLSATRRVADGDLATSLPATGAHEIGDLGRAFNDMVARLSDAQRQLTQADKLASVGRLAAGLAHEINNPLTAVLTYASFRLKRCEDPALAQDLEVIVRETKRCRDIVRGLLDVARQTPSRRQPGDVNEVVQRSLSVLRNHLALGQVEVAVDLAHDLPAVPMDANQIQQVVVNLLLNAADAVAETHGGVRVRTRRTEEPAPAVEIDVEDAGHGIPAEARAHLFEPFFTTKGARGTGLGLSITWGIVQAHGGTVRVASEPGQGSRFTVSLPLVPKVPS